MIKRILILLGLATAWVFGEKATINITMENTKWLTNDGKAIFNIYTKLPNGLSLDVKVYESGYQVYSLFHVDYDFSATVDTKESLKMSNVYQMKKEHEELVKKGEMNYTFDRTEITKAANRLYSQLMFCPFVKIGDSIGFNAIQDNYCRYERGFYKQKFIIRNEQLDYEYKLRFSKDLLKELDIIAEEMIRKVYWGD